MTDETTVTPAPTPAAPAPTPVAAPNYLDAIASVDANLTLAQARVAAQIMGETQGLSAANAVVLARANHANMFSAPQYASAPTQNPNVVPGRSNPVPVEAPKTPTQQAAEAELAAIRQMMDPATSSAERIELGTKALNARRAQAGRTRRSSAAPL